MQIDKKKLLLKNLPSVRQMLAFITVYQYGHMSAAAEELALTQPAVTVLIKELELKLGVKLFDRATRTLKPTSAAELALPYIVRALDELDDLRLNMLDYNELNMGGFTLAITPNNTHHILSTLLSKFIEIYPHIKVNILECEPLELLPALFKDKADLSLGSLEKALPTIQQYPIMQDPLVAIHHPHYSVQSSLQTWTDLHQEKLILTKRGYGIRHQIDQHLYRLNQDQTVNIHYEVSLISTAISLVKSGLGVGVVPLSSIRHVEDQLIVSELKEPIVSRQISLLHVKEKSLNPSAQRFLDYCQSNFSLELRPEVV